MNENAPGPVSTTHVAPRADTPAAGAVAGLAFTVLFTTAIVLLLGTATAVSSDTGAWLESGSSRVRIAVTMMPFAGIAFLWFIGVARARLGDKEDKFFATVFLGSGLLFLAMVFAATATAAAIVAAYSKDPGGFADTGAYYFAREFIAQTFGVYALRMAGVFMLSQSTLWLRTGVMPRWLAFVTTAVAIALLVVSTQSVWVTLVFPAWVGLVSVYILITRRGRTAATA